MSELSKADEELMRLATADDTDESETKPEAKSEVNAEPKEETLELGSDEAPQVTPEQAEEEKRKGRSHSPIQRINTLTAKLREAERRAAELEARVAPVQEAPIAPDPNAVNADGSPKYEFGEADPQFLKDWAVHSVHRALAEKDKTTKEQNEQATAKNAWISKINDGVTSIEKVGPEKYPDFEEVLSKAVGERDGPLPPLLSIGIAASPAGADISYHLAKNAEEAAKIEELAQTKPQAAAVAFGELEGQYLDSDDDLDLSDQLDMARMLGRMKSRLAGKKADTVERKTTKAPPPPDNRSRGAAGQFEVGDDTDDFRAFEKKYSRG